MLKKKDHWNKGKPCPPTNLFVCKFEQPTLTIQNSKTQFILFSCSRMRRVDVCEPILRYFSLSLQTVQTCLPQLAAVNQQAYLNEQPKVKITITIQNKSELFSCCRIKGISQKEAQRIFQFPCRLFKLNCLPAYWTGHQQPTSKLTCMYNLTIYKIYSSK